MDTSSYNRVRRGKKLILLFCLLFVFSTIPRYASAAVDVKVGTFTANTSTGNQAVTGVGFQPKAVIFWTAKQTATGNDVDSSFSYGVATGVGEEWSFWGNSKDTTGNAIAESYFDTTKALIIYDLGGAAVGFNSTVNAEADFVSFDSDGFTINWADAPTAGYIINYKAIGGSDITGAKASTTQWPGATGNQAITGVGFQPDFVMIGSIATTNTGPSFGKAHQDIMLGIGTASSQAYVTVKSEDNRAVHDNYRVQGTGSILEIGNNDATIYNASLSSLDSDGFTLNWTLADNGTASHYGYLVLKGGQHKVGNFTTQTSTGNFSTTGVGFQPSGLVALSTFTAAGTYTSDSKFSIGMASGASNQAVLGSEDDESAETADSRYVQDKVYVNLTSGTPTLTGDAAFVSFDSGGFTLNQTDADPSSETVHYWVIGSEETAAVTVLGDGTDPSNATIAPGASATDLDAFELATDTGTDTVTALTVTLSPASSYSNLSKVEVTNASNVDVCTDIDSPSSITLNFTGCSLSVTTSTSTYKVRITPKSHANMAAPATGVSYDITGTVTAITATNSTSGSDTDSATVTVDNLSPGNVVSPAAASGDGQNGLAWTNPGDSDLSTVMVLASTTAITFTPVEGTTYSTSTLSGASRVACYGLQESCTDTSLSNGTAYYYKIFTLDGQGNWSDSGVVPSGSPATPVASVTTLADGTDPSDATVAPGSGVADLDAFTLTTNTGSDTVTALTVTLSPSNATTTLSRVEVTDASNTDACTDVTINGSSSNILNFTGCSLSVTTSATAYKVRITPLGHADMPAPPGSSIGVTGTVTSITATNSTAGSDSDSATLTLDNASPSDVTSGTASAGDTEVSLSWTNPGDSDLLTVMVVASTTAITFTPVEGTAYSTSTLSGASRVACYGLQTSCTDTSLSNGTAYYYKVFTRDSRGNWSTGATPTGSPATPAVVSVDLSHYRWRYDDGGESSASYIAGEDTAVSSEVSIGDRIRLRMLLANSGGSASGYTYRLEHSSTTCSAWYAVPKNRSGANGGTHWEMSLTTNVADGSSTSDSSGLSNPGGMAFLIGEVKTADNTTSPISLGQNKFTELEFSMRSTASAIPGVTYCFRATNAGSTTGISYSETPQISLAFTSTSPIQGSQDNAGGEDSGVGPVIQGGDEDGGGANAGDEGSGSGPSQGGGTPGGGGGDVGFLNKGKLEMLTLRPWNIFDRIFGFLIK